MCQNSSPQTSTFVTERDQAFLNLAAAWRAYADKVLQEGVIRPRDERVLTEHIHVLKWCADNLEMVVKTGSTQNIKHLIEGIPLL